MLDGATFHFPNLPFTNVPSLNTLFISLQPITFQFFHSLLPTPMSLPSVTAVDVDNVTFPPSVTPPSSAAPFFLAGAGVRGLQIQDNFVKFTAIGIYLQSDAVPLLSVKWNANSAPELTDSVEFFRDIVTGNSN